MLQRMTVLGALISASLFASSPAHAAPPLHPECVNQYEEVRVWNGTDHVIEVAVEKTSPFNGSDSYYDVQPNQVRCWSRSRLRAQIAVWIKDGGSKNRFWMSTQVGNYIDAWTNNGIEMRSIYWTPPPPAAPPPLSLNPRIVCIKGDTTEFRMTNNSDHDMSLALLRIDTKPNEGDQLQWWRIKPTETKCWAQPPVAKPTMVVRDGEKQSLFMGFPRENAWAYSMVSGTGRVVKLDAAAPQTGARWDPVAGPAGATLKQISVGSATAIWGLDTGGTAWRWTGSAWEKKACCVSTLSVASDGTVWATNPPDALRVLKLDVANNKWTWNIPTGMKQVATVNATTAYGLDNGGALFKLNGAAWEKKGCCVSQISIGADGELWATNPPDSQRVLRWDSAQWTWDIPSGMTYVSVGNAKNIWALDEAGLVYKWSGTAWTKMPGTLSNISVASDGTVWGLDAKGAVSKWIP